MMARKHGAAGAVSVTSWRRFAVLGVVGAAMMASGCDAATVKAVASQHGVELDDAQVAAIVAHHGRSGGSIQQMIRRTWAGTGQEERAVRIARCESGFNPSARNGQYKGIFQMGSREFATYGKGDPFNAIDNIEAAFRYWQRSGWGPWECKG